MKAIRYSDILQNKQEDMWYRMLQASKDFGQNQIGLRGLFRRFWVRGRQFLLYNFSDAAVIGQMGHMPNSVYNQTMDRIEEEIRDGWRRIPKGEHSQTSVVMIADSLGGIWFQTIFGTCNRDR